MSSMRGTKPFFDERIFKKWITENKQMKSFVSKGDEGQKISCCKGTTTLWIKKQQNKAPTLPQRRVLVINKGTKRIIV